MTNGSASAAAPNDGRSEGNARSAEPRYKLLGRDDLFSLPPLTWRLRGVLPAKGLAALYGIPGSGKSFLALDMGCAIAEGCPWFGRRVKAAPVVYVGLEGEAGLQQRVAAWEAHNDRKLPDRFQMVLQEPFQLTSSADVNALAAVVPAGAVVIIDTLNRAAPTSDENISKDMGEILKAAKQLQARTGGLVLLVHHSGKDSTRGLRGHSSLLAALDAAVEVVQDGSRRKWRVAKSKDGQDGDTHAFKLQTVMLPPDANGDPISSCVVVPDTAAKAAKDKQQQAKVPRGENQRLVLAVLRPLFEQGEAGKPGAPLHAKCIELESAILAGAAKLTCRSDKRNTRAREAISGLVARGVLGLNEGWLWLA